MTQAKRALISYFSNSLETLPKDYEWPIPAALKFSSSGDNYQDNVNFKHHLSKQWEKADFEERVKIANDVVAVWGGVRNNKAETLKRYVKEYTRADSSYPIAGVASYSKILGIADPEKYAIYDARVAVSLNAIQYIYDVEEGLIFNYIPGRNNTTGNALKKTGFVYTSPFKKKDLKALGWKSIKRDETYPTYLSVLNDVLMEFPESKLYQLEMALFANAEKLATKAIQKSRN